MPYSPSSGIIFQDLPDLDCLPQEITSAVNGQQKEDRDFPASCQIK